MGVRAGSHHFSRSVFKSSHHPLYFCCPVILLLDMYPSACKTECLTGKQWVPGNFWLYRSPELGLFIITKVKRFTYSKHSDKIVLKNSSAYFYSQGVPAFISSRRKFYERGCGWRCILYNPLFVVFYPNWLSWIQPCTLLSLCTVMQGTVEVGGLETGRQFLEPNWTEWLFYLLVTLSGKKKQKKVYRFKTLQKAEFITLPNYSVLLFWKQQHLYECSG